VIFLGLLGAFPEHDGGADPVFLIKVICDHVPALGNLRPNFLSGRAIDPFR